MKKIYSLLILVLISVSCSDADDIISKENPQLRKPGRVINALDPTKLVKVIVWPGIQNAEKHLYFYPNGLLRKITASNENVVKNFVYDANQDLVTINITAQSSTSVYSINFTYDDMHRVTSMNGKEVNYDSVSNKYIINYDPTPLPPNDPECPGCYDDLIKHEINLSSEYLATNEYFTYEEYFTIGQPPIQYGNHGIYAGYYSNNNMAFTSNWTDPSGSTYSHDNKVNPLKAAMLPFGRAMAVFGYDRQSRIAEGIFNSANNVIFDSYGNDPVGQTTGYVIEYNANNLPITTTANSYYFGVLESSHIATRYYYQGGPIP